MSDEEMRSLFIKSKEFLGRLSEYDGSLWKKSAGEMQYQYNEMAIWILVYDDSDTVEVHDRLRKIVDSERTLFEALDCVLLYELITEKGAFGLSVKSNRAVLGELNRDDLPGRWFPMTKKATLFASENSRRGI